MKYYNIESKTYGFLIYVGIGIIILNVYVFAVENISASTNDNLTIAILQLFVGLMVITSAIICGIIAYKLNRSVIFWIIITLLFAPISLIVLWTKKLYLEPDLRKIHNQYESEYFLLKLKLKKDLAKSKISQDESDERLRKTLISLNKTMNEKMQEKEKKIISDLNKEVIHKVENTGDGRVLKIYNSCPACKAKLSKDDYECPDCGLSLR